MYEYFILEGMDYPLFYFKNTYGNKFNVSFKPHDFLQGFNVFHIGVDCMNSKKPEKDTKVGATVYSIIIDFLSDNYECLIAFVCDSTDNRHKLRKRKFNCWYNAYNESQYILKNYDIYVEEHDITYFTSIIFDPNIHPPQLINQTYGAEIESLSQPK